MEEKFYQKQWFMWLMLIFIAPVGIVLLWKYKRFSPTISKVLSGVFAVWFVLVCYSVATTPTEDEKTDKPAAAKVHKEKKVEQKKKVKKVASKPAFNVATMQVTKENVRRAIKKTMLDEEKLSSVSVTIANGKAIVYVYYKIGEVWDEKDVVRHGAKTATNIFAKLFKNPYIEEIDTLASTSMTDAKGNSVDENVVDFSMTKRNASDVNWPKFKEMVSGDYNSLIKVANTYYIAPGIAKALN